MKETPITEMLSARNIALIVARLGLGAALALNPAWGLGHVSGQAAGQAQTAAHGTAQAAQHSLALTSGSQMNAKLNSTLDAKKAKVGQSVVATTTSAVKQHGKVVLPKGSKLFGHITQVNAAGHGHAGSTVGVLFDHAVTPKGTQIPLNAGITSVFNAASSLAASGAEEPGMAPLSAPMPMGGGMGGGLLGGAGGLAGGVVGGAAGAVSGTAGMATGPLSAQGAAAGSGAGWLRSSNGLPLSIRPLTLGSGVTSLGQGSGHLNAGNASAGGTLLSSSRGNLRLDKGTRVRLTNQASASGNAQASTPRGSAQAGGSASAQASESASASGQ